MAKVYLVFEGDEYLSMDSLVLMGVYDDIDTAISNIINELYDKGLVDKEYATQERLFDELSNNCQTFGFETNYIIKSANLNEWGEI